MCACSKTYSDEYLLVKFITAPTYNSHATPFSPYYDDYHLKWIEGKILE